MWQPSGDVVCQVSTTCGRHANVDTGLSCLLTMQHMQLDSIQADNAKEITLVVVSRQVIANCESGSAASGMSEGPLNQYCKFTRPASMLPSCPKLATLRAALYPLSCHELLRHQQLTQRHNEVSHLTRKVISEFMSLCQLLLNCCSF